MDIRCFRINGCSIKRTGMPGSSNDLPFQNPLGIWDKQLFGVWKIINLCFEHTFVNRFPYTLYVVFRFMLRVHPLRLAKWQQQNENVNGIKKGKIPNEGLCTNNQQSILGNRLFRRKWLLEKKTQKRLSEYSVVSQFLKKNS